MSCSIVRKFIITLWMSVMLVGCQFSDHAIHQVDEVRYFRVYDTLGIRAADVYDPWQDSRLMVRYYLVRDSIASTPSDGIRIRVPLKRIAVSSATHIGYLQALGEQDNVVALTTPERIYHLPPKPVINIGEDIRLDKEAILRAQPDALLISRYGKDTQYIDGIRAIGIPVIEMVEWKENSPIARSEWIRFVGAFVGKDSLADTISKATQTAYYQAMDAAKGRVNRVSIVSGMAFRGTWYMPSGNTYMGRLFRDANAKYALAGETSESSIPLNIEEALELFSEADVWLGCSANSLDELAAIDEKHTWMKAYQTGRVYSFNRRQTGTGANDFWEMGVVHPDWILNDIRWALYPEQMKDYQPVFIERLQ